MKLLYVGDVHARPEDLDDCQALLDLVYEQAQLYRPDGIIFLGDQHHTHGIIHLDVIGFWRRNLLKLTGAGLPAGMGFDVTLLVGNHDMSGDLSSPNHAIMAYQSMDRVFVVDQARAMMSPEMVFLPYMGDNAAFVKKCQEIHATTVVCHQEFNGAEYENGFFSSTGVEPAAVPQTLLISGHIHTPQILGKVWYLGAPRWLTAADANQDRFIYVVEHDSDGSVLSKVAIPTGDVCQRIFQLEDTPAKPLAIEEGTRHKYIVDIIGPQAWIEERRPLWAGKARIRTHRTDQQIIRLKESEGIEKALVKFATEFIPPQGTHRDILLGMVKTRLMETT